MMWVCWSLVRSLLIEHVVILLFYCKSDISSLSVEMRSMLASCLATGLTRDHFFPKPELSS